MNSILEKLILNENQFFNKIDLVTRTLYTENVRNQQVWKEPQLLLYNITYVKWLMMLPI